jgi:hypothetical protein
MTSRLLSSATHNGLNLEKDNAVNFEVSSQDLHVHAFSDWPIRTEIRLCQTCEYIEAENVAKAVLFWLRTK